MPIHRQPRQWRTGATGSNKGTNCDGWHLNRQKGAWMPRRAHRAVGPSVVTLHVGESVAVNVGVKDPDLQIPIHGWQGRVIRLESDRKHKPLVHIQWDSQTLRGMDPAVIARCE